MWNEYTISIGAGCLMAGFLGGIIFQTIIEFIVESVYKKLKKLKENDKNVNL